MSKEEQTSGENGINQKVEGNNNQQAGRDIVNNYNQNYINPYYIDPFLLNNLLEEKKEEIMELLKDIKNNNINTSSSNKDNDAWINSKDKDVLNELDPCFVKRINQDAQEIDVIDKFVADNDDFAKLVNQLADYLRDQCLEYNKEGKFTVNIFVLLIARHVDKQKHSIEMVSLIRYFIKYLYRKCFLGKKQ